MIVSSLKHFAYVLGSILLILLIKYEQTALLGGGHCNICASLCFQFLLHKWLSPLSSCRETEPSIARDVWQDAEGEKGNKVWLENLGERSQSTREKDNR